ncbi:glycosyltransferase [Natronospira bacteriovora]|uniref:Glycosyltransferase n=1 Tax=Natronospira bacteriovora TaxID=3069753 RepID=A0ABU0W891_9GAMM|nr:glycosyltransferase [Natronospira sp. AB-CW4]MDQ2070133.1 glycosyltransferase [Natronospira sp. AB-CW4]
MAIARSSARFLLQVVPNPVKRGLRAMLPKGLYGVFVRLTRGEPLFWRRPPKTARAAASQASALDTKLWGGFSKIATDELEILRLSPTSTPAEAINAALSLARFYAADDQHEKALDRLAMVRAASPSLGRQNRVRLISVHSLLALGRIQEARHLLDLTLTHGKPNDGHACAAMASSYVVESRNGDLPAEDAHRAYLDWMNRPLRAAGFAGIGLRDADRGLRLNNLVAADPVPRPEDMSVKVSVLMAAYNGEDNLGMAARSILEQSWENLELVIVDDASTDDTWRIIESLMAEDSRVVGIRQEQNGGAYVARNTALQHASGDYVVVNDADDWAHPQKIETQMLTQLAKDAPLSNMSFRVRIDPEMVAQPRLDSPHVPIIHNDYSALMLKRERALEMGGWDSVRFSADAEFVERLRALEGAHAVKKIHTNVPLSFSLFDGNNLTASSATSIWTNRFGSRHEYVRHFREWHRSGDDLRKSRRSQTDPFPVPGISYYGPNSRQSFDVILVSDFRLPGGTTHCNLEYMREFTRMGLKVAILPWSRYELTYEHAANNKITQLCRELGIVTLAHGETADCQLLLIHHPPIMMHKPDRIPEVNAERIAILANQSAQRVRSGPNEMYEPSAVQAAVGDAFGKPGTWIPISPVIRSLLEADPACGPIAEEDWIPMLNLSHLKREPKWRGDKRPAPVAGRHCRDQWIKWPATAEATAAAYCAGGKVKLHLMGGATTAIRQLGEKPANWRVDDFDTVPVSEYVSNLDFFLHYIHEDAIEAFGRNIAEAMAAGVPVICSPSFRDCFGDAAICVEPEAVEDTIFELWNDPDAYRIQAEAGQRFVDETCAPARLQARFERFMDK